MRKSILFLTLLLVLGTLGAPMAQASTELLTNGGFESGLAGWTVSSSAGSLGSWFAGSGGATPQTGNPTVGAASGTGYAVTDQFGPGTNALSQDFTVALGTSSLTWSFDMFVNDWGAVFDPKNQYLTFGLMADGTDPLSGSYIAGTLNVPSSPVLVSGGTPNPYIHYSFDILPFLTAGKTYQIDFLESDQVSPMHVGVDNVSIQDVVTTSAPEPSSLALLFVGLGAVGLFARRQRGSTRQQLGA
jgi:PEP-CTERM motif